MLLNLTTLSSEPIHNQISRQLTERILSGSLKSGSEMPSERAFASQLRVGTNSIRKAYLQLEEDGLIQKISAHSYRVSDLSNEQKQAIARQRLMESESPLNVVEIFSRHLSSVFDAAKLQEIFTETLQTHMKVGNVYYSMQDDQTEGYVISNHETPADNLLIDKDDPLLQEISRVKYPVHLHELTMNHLSGKLLSALQSRKVQVVFPLRKEGRLLGFIGLTERISKESYRFEDLTLIMVLINQFLNALTTARYYLEAMEKKRIEEEIEMARKIQADILPRDFTTFADIDLGVYSCSSRTIGGDYYDYLPIDEHRFGLVIADACGKGLPAAMLISQIQSLIHNEFGHGHDLSTILTHVNQQIVRFTPKDKFITLVIGIFDRSNYEFEYATAGHNYPILIHSDKRSDYLKSGGPGLGIFANPHYKTEKVRLSKGDCLFFYTDGVTEAMNPQHEEYGEFRLQNMISSNQACPADDLIDQVLNDLKIFQMDDNLQDDQTMIVLKIK